MYYHLLIEDNSNQKILFDCDLDEENMKTISSNYKSGNEFHFNGYKLEKIFIRRFLICESVLSIEKIVKTYSDFNFPLTKENILSDLPIFKDEIKDITTRVLNSIQLKHMPSNLVVDKNTNKVFIVHGHDDSLKNEVESFIKELNLNPIILHKKASSGSTIIEKIENHVNKSSYGITLYSPCDVGGKNENNLNPRARQNVVFEHGFLIGRLGRDKTCAIIKSDLEKPNDISGLVYIPHDKNEGWKVQLFRELKRVFNNIVFPV